MIDRWTLVHLAFWFVVGANFSWHKFSPLVILTSTIVGVFAWEVAEAWMERKGWVSGNESWVNRWISDPLVGFIGVALGWWWV